MRRYVVTLESEERVELEAITRKGSHPSQKVINALILLNCGNRRNRGDSRLAFRHGPDHSQYRASLPVPTPPHTGTTERLRPISGEVHDDGRVVGFSDPVALVNGTAVGASGFQAFPDVPIPKYEVYAQTLVLTVEIGGVPVAEYAAAGVRRTHQVEPAGFAQRSNTPVFFVPVPGPARVPPPAWVEDPVVDRLRGDVEVTANYGTQRGVFPLAKVLAE